MKSVPKITGGVCLLIALACNGAVDTPESPWTLSDAATDHVRDPALADRIFKALDAAAEAGTDPSISHFHVRAGTTIPVAGTERAIVGGNTEYAGYPEAIHGETSLLNHVISTVGPEAAKRDVEFLAFYKEGECSGGGSCGDCRDYLMTTTRWQDLLMVCGQASDHTVHVHRFAQWVVPEADFPVVGPEQTGLTAAELEALTGAAREARGGGVSLFTPASQHLGVAALATSGAIYRAAGADDAAFHYRYPVGAVLQQAATHRDYFLRAIVVAGGNDGPPRVSYRDRQYGYEFSSFNRKRGLPPIQLLLVEETGGERVTYRATTFEEALPGAFSAASFMPEAVDAFLAEFATPEPSTP